MNLIAYHYAHRTDDDAENRFMEAVRKALLHVEGTYGIAVLCRFNDGEIVAARKGSPLLIGVGRNERLVSSDVLGFAGRASNVIYLEDNQIASVTADNCDIVTIGNKPVSYTVGEIDWKLESASSEIAGTSCRRKSWSSRRFSKTPSGAEFPTTTRRQSSTGST